MPKLFHRIPPLYPIGKKKGIFEETRMNGHTDVVYLAVGFSGKKKIAFLNQKTFSTFWDFPYYWLRIAWFLPGGYRLPMWQFRKEPWKMFSITYGKTAEGDFR